MELYRSEHIRNNILSKYNKPDADQDLKKEVSTFFSAEYIINRYKLPKIHLENTPYYSFLIDEDTLSKHLLNFSLNFGKNLPISRFKKFKLNTDEVGVSGYDVKEFPAVFNDFLYAHQQQEHIQQLALLQREAIRVHKERKGYFNSVSHTEMPSNIKSSRILSLDIEYSNLDIYEVGLSYFNEGKINNRYMITNLKTGTREHQFRFNFGESVIVPKETMLSSIDHMLKKSDYVLLHGGLNDLFLLAKHGIDLAEYPNLKILDTYHLYANHFNKNSYDQTSLVDMLHRFSIDYNHLHNAGNDAAYTLMALLHMNEKLEAENNKPSTKIKIKL